MPHSRRPPPVHVALHDLALGGTERTAVRLAGAWARAGAEVTILCTAPAGPLAALLDPAVAVMALGRGGRGPLGRPAFARAVRDALRTLPPGVVFAPGNFHWPVAAAAARDGRRVVAQVSAALDKPQRGALRQAAFEAVSRARLRHAAAIVALSGTARGQIARIVPGVPAVAIPLPALDDDAPPPRPAPPGAPLVLAAGRLVPEKGFATLIEAFARIGHSDARLRIVGAGPEEARLRALADRLGIGGRVALPGYRADIRADLDAARLLVLPSRFEGFPAVLVEALGAGRPVVATDCTPATALLADGGGRVVPIGDAGTLGRGIADVLASPPPDPATLAARVARHRLAPVARAYLDLFAEVAP